MVRKTETITLSIKKGTKEKLEQVAERLNLLWGDRPSISGLLNAIASETVMVDESLNFTDVQLQALEKAINALTDCGEMQEANILMELLLEKGNLKNPFREDLITKIAAQGEIWRREIDNYLTQKQPFHLVYINGQKEQEQFNIVYGEIKLHEKRLYLDAWCQEINPDAEIQKLKHNRCFRLDRIQHLTKLPTRWRSEGLDFIEVTLHFYGGMIKAYESKIEDIDVRNEGDKLVVIRKVSNPFWLVREILPYGYKCEIVSPEVVREKYIEEIKKITKIYG